MSKKFDPLLCDWCKKILNSLKRRELDTVEEGDGITHGAWALLRILTSRIEFKKSK